MLLRFFYVLSKQLNFTAIPSYFFFVAAQTQERLSKRLLELQERQEHIVKRCGPGGFKSEKGTKDNDDQDGSPLILSRGK